nr:PREDICTED: type I inositol 1,4,5-trisphosphate 5-phosphatase-like [Paralichthys olivaceus]
MDSFTDVLLVTANVGSLFDNLGEIQSEWLLELYKTVHSYKPQFIALHFQEVGGKDYMVNMGHAENFFRSIESNQEMKDYNRVCIYVDNRFQAEDSFTALGSMYFIHKTLKDIYQYDFNVKDFKAVSGQSKYVGSLDGVTTVEKEKFPKNFWPDFKWSRKGFMRTRWIIHNQYHLSTEAEAQTVKKDSSNEVEKIIWEEKDNDHQVLLQIEEKQFAYLHQAYFREDNVPSLLKYDKEVAAFHDVIREEDIKFPPSYPYSEEYTKPTQYMNTRCPAWCDRILMSHTAQEFIHRRDDGEKGIVYNTLGPNVCMGDHKPVFLFFSLKTNDH